MSNSKWRDIQGYEGRYQISTDGQVRNNRGRVLKPNSKSPRYHTVRLYSGGRDCYEDRLVHRLVAETFLDRGDGCEVNHIDGDRYNNDVSNLEWVTHRDNMRHAAQHNLVSIEKANAAHRKPVRCSNGIIYSSVNDAAKSLGILDSCISACLHGRYKTAGGYTFEFC